MIREYNTSILRLGCLNAWKYVGPAPPSSRPRARPPAPLPGASMVAHVGLILVAHVAVWLWLCWLDVAATVVLRAMAVIVVVVTAMAVIVVV